MNMVCVEYPISDRHFHTLSHLIFSKSKSHSTNAETGVQRGLNVSPMGFEQVGGRDLT